MHCPKCTIENELLVLDVLSATGQGLLCAAGEHCFTISQELLNSEMEITPNNLIEAPELGEAIREDVAQMNDRDGFKRFLRNLSTIAEYRRENNVASRKRYRILLVDDEGQNRIALTRAILANIDADVMPATNGSEAVELFQMHSPFDLVITDYNMPVLNGLEAAHAMRKMKPDQRIILMSADKEVAKQIDDPQIIFRYKLGSAKDFMKLIQQLCE